MEKILIVGAGLTGCVCANLLANSGYKVSIIDKSEYLGGLCRDAKYLLGNCYLHRFGPHCFHTKQKYIWDFVNRFSKWRDFHLQQMSCVNGKYFHFPINLNTIEEVYQTDVKDQYDVDKLIHDKTYDNPKNFEEYAINDVGTKLYEMFFKRYTEKQWMCKCDQLPPSIYKRVSIRYNKDNDLFQGQYQGLPDEGYNSFFSNLLNHPNIELTLSTEYNYHDSSKDYDYYKIVYTGGYDDLPYRCTYFSLREDRLDTMHSLVSLPQDPSYVRVTNYSIMHPLNIKGLSSNVNARVYDLPLPNNSGELCIPINTLENNVLYLQKRDEFMKLHPKAILIGRLATYKYLNMDEAIDQCFKILSKEQLIDLSQYIK